MIGPRGYYHNVIETLSALLGLLWGESTGDLTEGRQCWAYIFPLLLDWASYCTNIRVVGDLRRNVFVVCVSVVWVKTRWMYSFNSVWLAYFYSSILYWFSVKCQESWISWWRHQIETFPALLALCAGNSPVSGEFTKASDAELWCFLWSTPN